MKSPHVSVGLTVAMGVCCLVSTLAVIYTTHASRELFTQLQQLERLALREREDHGRLLIEKSTWAAHDRVLKLSAASLGMRVPELGEMQLVTLDGAQE